MNIPAIPDKLHKFLVFIGILILVYGYYSKTEKDKEYSDKLSGYIKESMVLTEKYKSTTKELQNLINEQAEFRKLADNDSITLKCEVIRKEIYANLNNPKILDLKSKELDNLHNQILNEKGNLLSLDAKLKKIKFEETYEELNKQGDLIQINKILFDHFKSSDFDIYFNYIFLQLLGFILVFFGIILWLKTDDIETKILLRQNIDKPTFSTHCQSCAKKFNAITKHGTEEDGNINYHFCSYCYSNGKFTEPELTMVQVQQRTNESLTALKVKKNSIKSVLYQIEKLDRWKINYTLTFRDGYRDSI